MSAMAYCFRVNAGPDIGMGHVVRTSQLALQLFHAGATVTYVVDYWHDALARYLSPFSVVALYDNSDVYEDEVADARRFSRLVDKSTVVVVDDYRFSACWESVVRDVVCRVVVIDDLANRAHNCDLLVDQRWAGPETCERYTGLVPDDCLLLLGPEYALLNPEYSIVREQRVENYEPWSDADPFTVTFSLGGGGDLGLLASIVSTLCHAITSSNIEFVVVVGPAAINIDKVESIIGQDSRVSLLRDVDCLASQFANSHLFIGAAGTSLYELNCTLTPALTFSLADNQENHRAHLESLGHYFHVPIEELSSGEHLSRWVVTMMDHYDRIRRLCTDCSIKVDGKGIARIVDRLLNFDADAFTQTVNVSCNSEASVIDNECRLVSGDELAEDMLVSEVSDRHINQYLDARNLDKNRSNMTETETISRLGHYSWWFNNGRSSYAVWKAGVPLLYIWHQLSDFEDQQYLIGGWFVCSENCGFEIASLALKWQLQMTSELHPGKQWVAVIAKNNQFVNLLNRYMGFKGLEVDSHAYRAACALFPNARPETFNYVAK